MAVPRIVLVLSILAAALPRPVRAQAPAEQHRREFCGLLRGCGLPEPEGACPGALAAGVPGVRYDEVRCREPRLLAARGVSTAGGRGFRLYRFLGRRYRIVYALEGQLAISEARMNYLLGDLPLAARLLTHFQKVAYSAEYLDPERRRFKGSRGGALSGEADLVSGAPAERTLFYFGQGVSQIGPWKLRGLGLVHVEYWPTGAGNRSLAYRMRVVASPTNAFYNVVMSRGLFKSVLYRKVREILGDIAEASRKLDQAGPAVTTGATGWSPAEKEKIEALIELP